MNLRIVPEGVGDDHKKEIRNGDDQAEKKTNGSFLPMGCDAERYSNEGKSHAGKRKGKPFVQLRPAGAALPFVCALQLVDQLGNRQGRAARSLFFLFVKFVEADRKSALSHVDAVVNFTKIARSFLVALLITRVVKAHQDALIRQIRLQHSSARKGDPHR